MKHHDSKMHLHGLPLWVFFCWRSELRVAQHDAGGNVTYEIRNLAWDGLAGLCRQRKRAADALPGNRHSDVTGSRLNDAEHEHGAGTAVAITGAAADGLLGDNLGCNRAFTR